MDWRKRLLNLLVTLDAFLLSVCTAGRSYPHETFSSVAWTMELAGKWQGHFFRPKIDRVAAWLHDPDHCQSAWENMRRQVHTPPEARTPGLP